MRSGFGLNTNLFETNILNLAVVVGIVVVVVGEALTTLLDERRQSILSALQEADQKAIEAQKLLEDAKKSVETARTRAQEISIQAAEAVEQESLNIKQKLKEDLQRLKESGSQSIQLERQRTVQSIVDKFANLALRTAESALFAALGPQGTMRSKQKELNRVHVRETFSQLKRNYLKLQTLMVKFVFQGL